MILHRFKGKDNFDTRLEIRHNFNDDRYSVLGTNITIAYQGYFFDDSRDRKEVTSGIMNLVIDFVKVGKEPEFMMQWDLKPYFITDTWNMTIYPEQTKLINIYAQDLDGDDFGMEIDLRQAKFFAQQNVSYYMDSEYRRTGRILIEPSLKDPLKMYPVYVTLFNKTKPTEIFDQKVLEIHIIPIPPVIVTF